MNKNFIKKLDQQLFFGFLKKIKNKFDDTKQLVLHKKFVNKLSKKTNLKNLTILNNDKKNILSK